MALEKHGKHTKTKIKLAKKSKDIWAPSVTPYGKLPWWRMDAQLAGILRLVPGWVFDTSLLPGTAK